MEKVLDWVKAHKALVIGLTVAFLFVVVLPLRVVSKVNTLQKQGTDKEAGLSAAYLSAQNELGSYISTFYEQLGVADRKDEALNTILLEAVKGAFEIPKSGAVAGGFPPILALQKAYPDLSGLDVYDRVLDTISAGRAAYKGKQDYLLDRLRDYDSWRRSGIIRKQMVRLAGFPSEGLEARIGTAVVTGEAARNQMYVIVLPGQAADAYRTGTLDPLTVTTAGQR